MKKKKRNIFLLSLILIVTVVLLSYFTVNLDASLNGHEVYDDLGDYIGCVKPGIRCVAKK